MRILRFSLLNYKRFRRPITVDLENTCSNIFRVLGPNGSGKSTFLNALSPLPDTPSDIIPGTIGQKSIEIEDENIKYVITYRYDPKTNGGFNSSGSIIKTMPDGTTEELCPSNNINDCKDIVKDIFKLDSNFETLTKMSGYDKKSLVSMTPSERKKFISTILNNLEVYNSIYKALSKRSSIFKSMINSITNKIDMINMSPDQIESAIQTCNNELAELNENKNAIIKELAPIQLDAKAKEYQLDIKDRINLLLNDNIFITNKLNEVYKSNVVDIVISRIKDNITHLEDQLTKTSNEEVSDKIEKTNLENKISEFKNKYKSLNDELYAYKNTATFNNFLQYESITFRENLEGCKKFLSTISDDNVSLYEEAIIAFENCQTSPEYFVRELDKLLKELNSISLKMPNIEYAVDGESLFYPDGSYNADAIFKYKHKVYKIISVNKEYIDALDEIDNIIMNNADYILKKRIMRDIGNLVETYGFSKRILNELYPASDNFSLEDSLSFIDNCKRYKAAKDIVNGYEQYLKDRNDGDIDIIEKIKDINKELENYTEDKYNELVKKSEEKSVQLDVLADIKCKIKIELEESKKYLELCDRYIANEKEIGFLKKEVVDTSKEDVLISNLNRINFKITNKNDELYKFKHSLDLLKEYMFELNEYNNKSEYVEILRKYASPSKGIQTIFISMYMNKILSIANNLLSRMFDGQFVLQPFVINENEFRIPVAGNGILIDDVSSMSTSQMAMINICINVALITHSSSKYRILKFDEADGPLDTYNRALYPEILNQIINVLGCEQAFIASQNSEFDASQMHIINLLEGIEEE